MASEQEVKMASGHEDKDTKGSENMRFVLNLQLYYSTLKRKEGTPCQCYTTVSLMRS